MPAPTPPPAVVGTAVVGQSQIGIVSPVVPPPPALATADFVNRILALLPQGWFGDAAQATGGVLYALVSAVAFELAYLYSTYLTLRLWARIRTATDGQLDAISADFYGTALPRKSGEADTTFLQRIIGEFFTARGTRPGISTALSALTGDTIPIILEPWNAQDTKGWSRPSMGFGIPVCCWGNASSSAAYSAFISVKRPLRTATNAQGAPGWSSASAGWSSGAGSVVGTTQWLPLAWLPQVIVDSDIIGLMRRSHAFGTNILTTPY